MTDTTTQSSSSSTANDPITLLRQLTGSNYHRAATEPPEVAHGYQAIADVLATVDPATWTPHTHELPQPRWPIRSRHHCSFACVPCPPTPPSIASSTASVSISITYVTPPSTQPLR